MRSPEDIATHLCRFIVLIVARSFPVPGTVITAREYLAWSLIVQPARPSSRVRCTLVLPRVPLRTRCRAKRSRGLHRALLHRRRPNERPQVRRLLGASAAAFLRSGAARGTGASRGRDPRSPQPARPTPRAHPRPLRLPRPRPPPAHAAASPDGSRRYGGKDAFDIESVERENDRGIEALSERIGLLKQVRRGGLPAAARAQRLHVRSDCAYAAIAHVQRLHMCSDCTCAEIMRALWFHERNLQLFRRLKRGAALQND